MTADFIRWSTGAARPLSLAILLACGQSAGVAQSIPQRSLSELTMVCAGCHNPEPGTLALEEAQRIPKLGGQQREYLENALHAYRTRQRDHFYMRGMALGLKGEELQRVLDHLSAPMKQKAAGQSAAAVPSQAASCVACHGDQTRSPATADTPRLAGQHATYIEEAYLSYARGKRNHPVMAPQARSSDGQPVLDREALQSVAKWFSAQPGLENR